MMANPEDVVDWPHEATFFDSRAARMSEDVSIETLTEASAVFVQELIRRNLSGYDEAGTVLASTFRRLANLLAVYRLEGASFFVIRDQLTGRCIGGAGIGPLHGLPPSEGLGEVRDVVIEEAFRGRGYGTRLLKRCVEEAKQLGYKRLYLETTPQMEPAQKLFLRFGFRPVTQAKTDGSAPLEKVPGYFILETLA